MTNVIDEFESIFGIVDDEFALTERFIDFEFASSGPIKNLQVIFLAMLVLVLAPVILLLIRKAFFWSQKCKRATNTVSKVLFFNAYIRFLLEAYLELSLTCLIRFQAFSFSTPSEKFHSTFVVLMFVTLVLFVAFALFYLQMNFSKLSAADGPKMRLGGLYLGIRTTERSAILSPVVFLVRRLTFAAILVTWSQRSYFQIQAIIFQCSLVMIYTGYMRPYEKKTTNTMELINETITILCSYFLIIFSGFVAHPEARFLSGWPLIGLITMLIALNMAVIGF